jgi:hypothetical protein
MARNICQKSGCLQPATHAACYGKVIVGLFCRKHCFELVSSNWGAKIQMAITRTNGKTILDFIGGNPPACKSAHSGR